MKFGVLVAGNSGSLRISMGLCSSFSFGSLRISIGLCSSFSFGSKRFTSQILIPIQMYIQWIRNFKRS